MRRSLITVIFLMFLFSNCLARQTDSTRLELKFSQNNRTYIWNNRLDFSHILKDKIEVSLLSQINSTLIKGLIFAGGKDRWQEDGDLKIDLNYLLSKNLSLGFCFNQDVNSLGNRKVTTDNWGLTSQFKLGKVVLNQQIGVKKIERKGGEERFL